MFRKRSLLVWGVILGLSGRAILARCCSAFSKQRWPRALPDASGFSSRVMGLGSRFGCVCVCVAFVDGLQYGGFQDIPGRSVRRQ